MLSEDKICSAFSEVLQLVNEEFVPGDGGLAFSPDSGLSSCSSDSEFSPHAPPRAHFDEMTAADQSPQHFTQLTNANPDLPFKADTEGDEAWTESEWLTSLITSVFACGDDLWASDQQPPQQQQQTTTVPCPEAGDASVVSMDLVTSIPAPQVRSVAGVTEHQALGTTGTNCGSSAASGFVNGSWPKPQAAIHVFHTGDGVTQAQLPGGLTYEFDPSIDFADHLSNAVKTELQQESSTLASYRQNGDGHSCMMNLDDYNTSDDRNNNHHHNNLENTIFYYDNCKDCRHNRSVGYEVTHCKSYQEVAYAHAAPCQQLDNTSHNYQARAKRHPLKRTERLWEFMLRLLSEEEHNPRLVQWVDRDNGMFRLNNSKAIAHMWGMRKNNAQMTYEKLSRALRYYYHRRILEPVLGKKLVYRFGPNATQVWEHCVYHPQGAR